MGRLGQLHGFAASCVRERAFAVFGSVFGVGVFFFICFQKGADDDLSFSVLFLSCKECEGAGSAGSCRILGPCRRGLSLQHLCCRSVSVRQLAAGFTADGSVENFKRRRQTELKHGRMGRCKSYVGVLDASGLRGCSRLLVVVFLLLLIVGLLPEWHAP